MSELLAGFDWTTPFIADACVQLSLPVRVASHGLKCNFPGSKAAGPARPARHAGSTDVFLEAIAAANQGDLLVIDNGGRNDEGCIGDLVVGEAFVSGLAATICWGTHRDTAAIQAMGARVWSLGTCPNGPLELRRRVATALSAANIGSHVTVTLEDYVFADDDGVVVVETATSHESSRRPGTLPPAKARKRSGCSRGSCCEGSSISTNTSRNATPIPITHSVNTSSRSAAR